MIYSQRIDYIRNHGFYLTRRSGRLMSAALSELDGLRMLDPEAITSIHNRYYPEVYRFAYYRVNDDSIAEDIAGDVFMRLLEAVHAGHGPNTNLRGWLISTTSNIVNDYFRKIYNRPGEEHPEMIESNSHLVEDPVDPIALTDAVERLRLLQSAINELTEEQKQVIALRFGNGYSLDETATVMGKNANAIKALQFRALAALRQLIRKDLL
jgi:RNA polymerase sigma-70 factor, ECF subfamily